MASPLADAYRAMRLRVLAMADALEPGQASETVPCCPEWTVHDLLAHMAGVPSDILSGNLDGVTTDPWTQAQVDARAGRPVADVVTELSEKGELLDDILAKTGSSFPANFFLDAWTHEWDLRQALDAPAVPDLRLLQGPLDHLLASASVRLDEANQPAIDLTLAADDPPTSEHHRLGSLDAAGGEALSLETTRFEFARLSLGRRSLDQIRSLRWCRDPGPAAAVLVVFTPSAADIVDPVISHNVEDAHA